MDWPLVFLAPRPMGGALEPEPSTMQFHSPQASHLPDHLLVTLRHLLQTYSALVRAI
jgi:hypothetical protein